jgi:hypothetical protein
MLQKSIFDLVIILSLRSAKRFFESLVRQLSSLDDLSFILMITSTAPESVHTMPTHVARSEFLTVTQNVEHAATTFQLSYKTVIRPS